MNKTLIFALLLVTLILTEACFDAGVDHKDGDEWVGH
jgi:hypothetical protein